MGEQGQDRNMPGPLPPAGVGRGGRPFRAVISALRCVAAGWVITSPNANCLLKSAKGSDFLNEWLSVH